jgi:hypothetical protein
VLAKTGCLGRKLVELAGFGRVNEAEASDCSGASLSLRRLTLRQTRLDPVFDQGDLFGDQGVTEERHPRLALASHAADQLAGSYVAWN